MFSYRQSGAFRLAAQRACAVDFGVALRFVFLCLHGSCGYTFRKAFIGLGNSR